MIAIDGMPNHIHPFIGMKLKCSLSDLAREIKKSSNEFINEMGYPVISLIGKRFIVHFPY